MQSFHIRRKEATIMAFFLFFMVMSGTTELYAKSLSVTVYNHGQALVHEVRSMDIEKGQNKVLFENVPTTINPKTLQIRSLTNPDKFKILDMNYEYDLINTKTLLDKHVGQKLFVQIADPEDSSRLVTKEALLIANNNRPVFKMDERIYIGNYDSVLLSKIPDGLRASPTLVWLVENQGKEKQNIEVSYLANGIKWEADYVLSLDRDEETASLNGWVTLDNKSGRSFENANLKLVAGDVNVVKPQVMRKNMDMMAMESAPASGMTQEELFEYHLYSLGRNINIKNKQMKQVSLLNAPKINIKKELVSSFGSYGHVNQRRDLFEQDVLAYISFVNEEKSGLGLPLPKGTIRAYQSSMDGSKVFIGEDRVGHTPVNRDVKLKLGKSFDVKVERTLVDSYNVSNKTWRQSWEIEVHNSKKASQKITLHERFPADWEIVSSSHEYKKNSARNISFDIKVEPESVRTVKYEVLFLK